jgi:hypothetical protein
MESKMLEESIDVDSDFAYLLTLLPAGWQEKAKELGALRRRREIPDAETLLRLLLIHLAEGVSLRQTAVLASQSKIANVSDVAVMARLKQSGDWFRWMNISLLESLHLRASEHVFGTKRRVRLVDATMISEPGPTGSSWRLNYAIELPSLHCDEFIVTEPRGANQGESFLRFAIEAGDLMIGDRGYGKHSGISHVVSCGGDVLVRFAWNLLPLYLPSGEDFNLFAHLRRLHGTDVGDWSVMIGRDEATRVSGRICAIRKSRQAARAAQRKARAAARKKKHTVSAETLEAAKYIFVFTTVPRDELPAINALEIYRGRWQIELTFKRLKSILGVGHLRKYDPEATRSWMQGKLFVALLIETLRVHAETFSPWGYVIDEDRSA